MLPKVNVRWETYNWSRAHEILHKYSKTEPSEALAKAVAFVVVDAKANTYFTTPSKIDAELNVETTPVLSTKGARAGLPLRSGKSTVDAPAGSLAQRIVLSRLNRYSNYNVLTDIRYALDRQSFSPGMGKAGFWAKVKMVAERMVKSRHSSTHFFQTSWNSVLLALAPLVPARFQGKFFRAAGKINSEIGSAVLNGVGTAKPILRIDNKLGMDPKYPTINELRNMAAHQLLEPALAGSISKNFQEQLRIIAERDLIGLNSQLGQLGVNIR